MIALSKAELDEIMEKVGQPSGGCVRAHVDVDKTLAMRRSGFSMRQIAAWFDVSRPTVYRKLKIGDESE